MASRQARLLEDFIAEAIQNLPEAFTNDLRLALFISAAVAGATLLILLAIAHTKRAAAPSTKLRDLARELLARAIHLFWTVFSAAAPIAITARIIARAGASLCAEAQFAALERVQPAVLANAHQNGTRALLPPPSSGPFTLEQLLLNPSPELSGSTQRVFAAAALALGVAGAGIIATAAGFSWYWVWTRSQVNNQGTGGHRRVATLAAAPLAALAAGAGAAVAVAARTVDVRDVLGCPPPSILATAGAAADTRVRGAVVIAAIAAAFVLYVAILMACTGPAVQSSATAGGGLAAGLAPDEPLLRATGVAVRGYIAWPFIFLFSGPMEHPRCLALLCFPVTLPAAVLHALMWVLAWLATALSLAVALGTADAAFEVMEHLHVVERDQTLPAGALLLPASTLRRRGVCSLDGVLPPPVQSHPRQLGSVSAAPLCHVTSLRHHKPTQLHAERKKSSHRGVSLM